MRAAVVRSFDAPPRFDTIDLPQPQGEHEILVDVLAAGLHPRVRSGADGTHYTSDGALPLVPGIDAVGRTPQGELLYFVAPDTGLGTMAEQAVVDRRRAITLPPGAAVLVLGATGNAGCPPWPRRSPPGRWR